MTMPRVLVLVHGKPNSIEAVRAKGLTRLHPSDRLTFCFRDGSRKATMAAWNRERLQFRPDLVYVLNTAMPGALLAPWWRMRWGTPYVLDTGDAIFEMARTSGIGGGWKLPALWAFEHLAQRCAAGIVVRGTRHQDYLKAHGAKQVEVIRDGYAEAQNVPPEIVANLKRKLGLEGQFVAGVMGSTVYSHRLGICYGWDLLESMVDLRDLPIRALIIGDGTGLPWLQRRAIELGVSDRVTFTGRIPYAEVPTYLRVMDVALSTQTNNIPGQVRTTGKLPEYMAAERFIIASRVGEAALVLPDLMLVDYCGEVDTAYPHKLAERIRLLQCQPKLLELRHSLPATARELFSYDVLSANWSRYTGQITARG